MCENTAHVWLWGALTWADGGGERAAMNGSGAKRENSRGDGREEKWGLPENQKKGRKKGRKKGKETYESHSTEAHISAQNELYHLKEEEEKRDGEKDTGGRRSATAQRRRNRVSGVKDERLQRNETRDVEVDESSPETWCIHLAAASSILLPRWCLPSLLLVADASRRRLRGERASSLKQRDHTVWFYLHRTKDITAKTERQERGARQDWNKTTA